MKALSFALCALIALQAVPLAAAANPTIGFGAGEHAAGVETGHQVSYEIPFSVRAATGEHLVDLEFQYRDFGLAGTVAWASQLKLGPQGGALASVGSIQGFSDLQGHQVDTNDGEDFVLQVTTTVATTPGDYSSFLRLVARSPSGDSSSPAVTYRFDFTVTPFQDDDNDGLPDDWEIEHFETIGAFGADDDPDVDGLPNLGEFSSGTDPNDEDTDADDLLDGEEVSGSRNTAFDSAPTDPLEPDSDDDGLADGIEVLTHGTDPNSGDTDDDGFNDLAEIQQGTNPLDAGSFPSAGSDPDTGSDPSSGGDPDDDSGDPGSPPAGGGGPSTEENPEDVPGDLDGDGIPDIDDPDANGDGEQDTITLARSVDTAAGSLRIAGHGAVRDDGTVDAELAFQADGASGLQLWRNSGRGWTLLETLGPDVRTFTDGEAEEGFRYKLTAFIQYGEKRLGHASSYDQVAGFADLPSVELRLTTVRMVDVDGDGRPDHMRVFNGGDEESEFQFYLEYEDENGVLQRIPFSATVAPGGGDIPLPPLTGVGPGTDFKVFMETAGGARFIDEGGYEGAPASSSNTPGGFVGIVAGGFVVLAAGVATAAALLVRRRGL